MSDLVNDVSNTEFGLATLILGAGKGTRMRSELPKVLHHVLGRPMIEYVIDVARDVGSEKIVVVVGHQAEHVKNTIVKKDNLEFVLQEPQLGTAHAVLQSEKLMRTYSENLFVLSGDVPLINSNTLREMLKLHKQMGVVLTLMTAKTMDPTGYGRIVRGFDGLVQEIVEEKDIAMDDHITRQIDEVNCGIYLFKTKELFENLYKVRNDNKQSEYYLPDMVKIFAEHGMTIATYLNTNFSETSGINTPEQLKEVENILQKRNIAVE